MCTPACYEVAKCIARRQFVATRPRNCACPPEPLALAGELQSLALSTVF